MPGHPTPLVLVVCHEPERVYRLRTTLRRDGFLPAFARSAVMAAALFSQIRIEAVVLFPGEELGDLTPLQEMAAGPGVPLFYIGEQPPFPEWKVSEEQDLPARLREALSDSGTA